METNADIPENERELRDTQIRSEQLRYTVWTVNHLDLILVIYTNNRIWTDGVNEKGFGHNDTIIQCQT